jgi:hypothetical protein
LAGRAGSFAPAEPLGTAATAPRRAATDDDGSSRSSFSATTCRIGGRAGVGRTRTVMPGGRSAVGSGETTGAVWANDAAAMETNNGSVIKSVASRIIRNSPRS